MSTTITVEQILAAKFPKEIFVGVDVDKEYKKIRSLFHPDHCHHPDAPKAFAKLKEFYDKLTTPKIMKEENINFVYDITYVTELYECFVNQSHVLLKVKSGKVCDNYPIIYQAFKSRIEASDRLKKDFSIIQKVKLKKGDEFTYILVEGINGLVPLRSVLAYFNNKLEWQTSVWIVTSMLNNACMYNHIGYVGNSFDIDSYFIDLDKHYGWDLAGFFFHCKKGEKLVALSRNAMDLYPVHALDKKVSDTVADIRMIQRTASIVFGDTSGTGLKLKDVPDPIVKFIQHPASDNADVIEWYSKWMDAIKAAYGKRVFHPSKANANDILMSGL